MLDEWMENMHEEDAEWVKKSWAECVPPPPPSSPAEKPSSSPLSLVQAPRIPRTVHGEV